jgi:acyl-CoA reductase-like NAD-dependent aldehyde dehydrogenase
MSNLIISHQSPTSPHNAWHEGSAAAWGALPMAERIAWVTKIADALEAIQPQIGALESLDTGKPVALATAVDANRSVQNFRFFAKSVTPLQFTTTQPTSPR